MELLTMLAAADPTGLDPELVKPGWLGLAVVVALALGVTVLVRSFAKHTRRANEPWEGEDDVTGSTDDADRPTT